MNHLTNAYNSDRGNSSLDTVLENLGIELPSDGMILDIGSGDSAIFERQGMYINPNLTIVALDPFLHDKWYRLEHMTEDFGLSGMAPANIVPAIAAVSQELPFRDNSFDMVVSHAAVPTYLPLEPKAESYKSFGLSFMEINRVLKLGAKAVLGPMEEAAYFRSLAVFNILGYIYSAENIPIQDYSFRRNPWFRVSFVKQ